MSSRCRARGQFTLHLSPGGVADKKIDPVLADVESRFFDGARLKSTTDGKNTLRFLDNAPFYGGAYIRNTGSGASCSSGFGVAGVNGSANYIMTAAHCGAGTWTTGTVQYPDGSTARQTLGNTIAAGRSTGRDVQLILAPAGGGVYWGGHIDPPNGNLGSNTYVAVRGESSNQAVTRSASPARTPERSAAPGSRPSTSPSSTLLRSTAWDE